MNFLELKIILLESDTEDPKNLYVAASHHITRECFPYDICQVCPLGGSTKPCKPHRQYMRAIHKADTSGKIRLERPSQFTIATRSKDEFDTAINAIRYALDTCKLHNNK
ncbi:MAG: hypothetical protein FWF34_00670 [Alphaproteobacteria bacterium]|nr:hypothetical protein [Alphaproteobacteria bacterium]MCL2889759.1 hypothetical protein [Alphaproteobacteria bacterium]